MSKLGKRLVCEDCGKKYYDLNRSKFACPKCGCTKTRKNSVKIGASVPMAIDVDEDEEMGNEDLNLEPLDDLELNDDDIEEQNKEDSDDEDENSIDESDDLPVGDPDDIDDD